MTKIIHRVLNWSQSDDGGETKAPLQPNDVMGMNQFAEIITEKKQNFSDFFEPFPNIIKNLMQEKNFDCPEFTHSYVKITNNDFIKSDLHIFIEKHLKYFFNKKQKGQPKTSGFSKICPINNKNYISAQTIAVGFGNVIEKSIKEWVEKYGWKQFEEFIQSDRRPNSKKGVSADLKIQKIKQC